MVFFFDLLIGFDFIEINLLSDNDFIIELEPVIEAFGKLIINRLGVKEIIIDIILESPFGLVPDS
jgi:hypothetical protein